VSMQGWRQRMEDAHLSVMVTLPPIEIPLNKVKAELIKEEKQRQQLKLNNEAAKKFAEGPKPQKALMLGVFDGHGH